MSDIPVPIIVIGKPERDRYIEQGYNAPHAQYSEEALHAECKAASDQVKAAIGNHWKHYAVEFGVLPDKNVHEVDLRPEFKEEGDFFMNELFGSTRFLCVEISTEEMLTPKLLGIVHEAVSRIEPDYSVDVCDAFYVLKRKDGMLYPRFNIFVEKGQILVYSESTDLLERLGIPRDAGSNGQPKREQ